MEKPRLFISAVSRELGSARQRIANILTRKGYEPVWQDIFGTEPGDLRDMLREKIDTCAGLIQITGDAYGAEPAEPHPDFQRCSYTQFEFLYAHQQKKKTWLLLAGPRCKRDTPIKKLDLPRAPHPDPAAYQSERHQLQCLYKERPEFRQHLRHTAESDLALDLATERLNDELAALRAEAQQWQQSISTTLTHTTGRQRLLLRLSVSIVGFLLLVLIGVWLLRGGLQQLQQGQEELAASQKLDPARLRAQLLESSERGRDAELASAAQSPAASGREQLREAARQKHLARIARIDDIVARFQELDTRTDTTAISRELARILAAEGADAALDYVEGESAGIYAAIDARNALEASQRRATLAPLLSAAQLQETRGDAEKARAAYEDLLRRDPDWPSALQSAAWAFCHAGGLTLHRGSITEALTQAQKAYDLATRHHQLLPEHPDSRHLLASALNKVGDALEKRRQPGDSEQALQHYTRSLALSEEQTAADSTSAQGKRDTFISLNNLSEILLRRRQPGDMNTACAHLTRSLALSEEALKATPASDEANRDVFVVLNKLGQLLSDRRQPGDMEQAWTHLTRSLALSEELLKKHPDSSEAMRDITISLEYLSELLRARGQPGDLDAALANYLRSAELREELHIGDLDSLGAARDYFVTRQSIGDTLVERNEPGDSEAALERYTSCLETAEIILSANPQSAEAKRDVSTGLERVGNQMLRMGPQGGMEAAYAHLTRSLNLREQLRLADSSSGQAIRDVTVSLDFLGDLLSRRGQLGDRDAARGHYARGLALREELLRASSESAEAKRDLSISHYKLADLLAARSQPGDLDQAITHYTRCLTLREDILKADPASPQAAEEIFFSLNNLRGLLLKRAKTGDAAQAREHYTRLLALWEDIRQARPASWEAAFTTAQLALALANLTEQTSKQNGRPWRQRAYDILSGLKEKGKFSSPAELQLLEELKKKLTP